MSRHIELQLNAGVMTVDLSEPDIDGRRSGTLGGVDLRDPAIEELAEGESDSDYNFAISGIEALVLAHACAGVDVESDAYIEGINTAVAAAANNLA